VNLIRVLKATVKAQARLPAPGLSTASTTKDIRRQRATTPISTQERAPPQGGTKAYQGLHGACLPRNASATCANDVPLETVAYHSVPMACGPELTKPGRVRLNPATSVA
jgi:hypothetical protein